MKTAGSNRGNVKEYNSYSIPTGESHASLGLMQEYRGINHVYATDFYNGNSFQYKVDNGLIGGLDEYNGRPGSSTQINFGSMYCYYKWLEQSGSKCKDSSGKGFHAEVTTDGNTKWSKKTPYYINDQLRNG